MTCEGKTWARGCEREARSGTEVRGRERCSQYENWIEGFGDMDECDTLGEEMYNRPLPLTVFSGANCCDIRRYTPQHAHDSIY